jgi:hypothetical protein
LSPLPTLEKLTLAEAAFYAQAQAAADGSVSAANALSGTATDYLSIVQKMFATGPAYVDAFNAVQQALSDAAKVAGDNAAGLDRRSFDLAASGTAFADAMALVNQAIVDGTVTEAERGAIIQQFGVAEQDLYRMPEAFRQSVALTRHAVVQGMADGQLSDAERRLIGAQASMLSNTFADGLVPNNTLTLIQGKVASIASVFADGVITNDAIEQARVAVSEVNRVIASLGAATGAAAVGTSGGGGGTSAAPPTVVSLTPYAKDPPGGVYGPTLDRPNTLFTPPTTATTSEAQYLAANPDVAAAVAAGAFKSGRHHFDVIGHTEDRPKTSFTPPTTATTSEAQYLAANPDVAAAVKAGAFTSGRHHFDVIGHTEDRPNTLFAPPPRFSSGGITPHGDAILHSGEIMVTGPPARVFNRAESAAMVRGDDDTAREMAALRTAVDKLRRENTELMQRLITSNERGTQALQRIANQGAGRIR